MKEEQVIKILIEESKEIYARHLELLDVVSGPNTEVWEITLNPKIMLSAN
jgi:hypothetical protein